MNRMQFVMSLVVMGFMSLVGSWLAVNGILGAKPADAQKADEDMVSAQSFVLKDKKGNVRGLFTVGDDDDVVFTMLDAKGTPHISSTVSRSGDEVGFVLSDQKGNARLSLISKEKEAASFTVHDEKGNPAAMLALGKNDYPLMTLSRKGKIASLIGVQEDGKSIISLQEGDFQYFAAMGGADAPSSILLNNERGKGLVTLSSDMQGRMVLGMNDGKEAVAGILAQVGGDSALFMTGGGSQIDLQTLGSGRAVLQFSTKGGPRFQAVADKDADDVTLLTANRKGNILWKAK